MVNFEPREDFFLKLFGEVSQFGGFRTADGPGGVIFGSVALDATGIQIVCRFLMFRSQDQGESR
jgi:hypothetical protein